MNRRLLVKSRADARTPGTIAAALRLAVYKSLKSKDFGSNTKGFTGDFTSETRGGHNRDGIGRDGLGALLPGVTDNVISAVSGRRLPAAARTPSAAASARAPAPARCGPRRTAARGCAAIAGSGRRRSCGATARRGRRILRRLGQGS